MAQSNQAISRPAFKTDRRLIGLLLMTVGVVTIGLLISYFPSTQELHRYWQNMFPQPPQTAVAMHNRTFPNRNPAAEIVGPEQQILNTSSDASLKQKLDIQFQRAVVMLHAKQYEHALVALRQVLAIAPRMPEAYVNSGYALIGLERFNEAKENFLFAIDLHPEQVNAYYGLAVALDALHDRMGAMGAMYSFLHQAAEDNPFRRKAAAAVWEWEAERNKQLSSENRNGVR